MSALSDRLGELGVTVSSVFFRTVKDKWEHDAWTCLVKFGEKSFETPYKTGIGHRKAVPGKLPVPQAPKGADVVSCLLSDASSSDCGFEDWCGEFGYDTDSRSALDTYLVCQNTEKKLVGLFGLELFRELSSLEH